MILGLTGSIAMGKTTTAEMFRKLGYPVFDADSAVHQLYAKNGAAAKIIQKLFPDVMHAGAVNRKVLAEKILKTPTVLATIENIVHPMVKTLEQKFISEHKTSGAQIIVLDIPLLFEVKRRGDVDKVLVVFATSEQQKARAMARPGMTEKKFKAIRSKQMSNDEKRLRADYVIDTSKSIDETLKQVKDLVAILDPEFKN